MDSVLITPRELVADETTLTDRYGSFVREPLERGYALTIGNALRRILLSSIRADTAGTNTVQLPYDGRSLALHVHPELGGDPRRGRPEAPNGARA